MTHALAWTARQIGAIRAPGPGRPTRADRQRQVLEVLMAAQGPLFADEIARRVGIGRSYCAEMLVALAAAGRARKQYRSLGRHGRTSDLWEVMR